MSISTTYQIVQICINCLCPACLYKVIHKITFLKISHIWYMMHLEHLSIYIKPRNVRKEKLQVVVVRQKPRSFTFARQSPITQPADMLSSQGSCKLKAFKSSFLNHEQLSTPNELIFQGANLLSGILTPSACSVLICNSRTSFTMLSSSFTK